MPRRALRSTTLKKVRKKTPGGKLKIFYSRKKSGRAKCAKCKKSLAGLVQAKPSKLKNMPKSQKTVNRPYGGNLCSRCTRQEIKDKLLKD